MALRGVLLRIMLWSLAMAAVVGALSILVASHDVIGRVVGTAVLTGVAAGLMMVMSRLMDKEVSRSAGLLGMAAVLCGFLLALLLIWDISFAFAGMRWSEAILLTILFIPVTCFPAMFFLRLLHVSNARLAARVGLCTCAATFVLLDTPQWLASSTYLRDALTESGWAVGVFGLVAAAALAGKGGAWRYGQWAGAIASLAGLCMALTAIWKRINEGSVAFTIVCSIAATVAHANLVLLCPLSRGQKWVSGVTIAAAAITALCIDVAALEWLADSDTLMRSAGASGFIAACGSLALLVLARLNRKIESKPVLSEIRELTLICPGCQSKSTVPTGASQCSKCSLRFSIRVEEPHCPKCDYLLFMLSSDRCPECGEIILPVGTPN